MTTSPPIITEKKCLIHNEPLIVGKKRTFSLSNKDLRDIFNKYQQANCPNINIFNARLGDASVSEYSTKVTIKKRGRKLRSAPLKRYKHDEVVYYCDSCRSKADVWLYTEKSKRKAEREQKIQCEHCKKYFQAQSIEQHKLKHKKTKKKPRKKQNIKVKSNKSSPAKGLKLITKKGRIKNFAKKISCFIYHGLFSTLTYYSQTTKGAIYLCHPCKTKLRNKSFPPKNIDALDRAASGGGFETNRRKH